MNETFERGNVTLKKSNIGGQGVLEGVMMRSPQWSGMAVRKQNGSIATWKKENSSATTKNKFLGLPIVRGVVSFVEMLVNGVKTITESAKMYDEAAAEEMEPSKFEKFLAKKTGKDAMDIMMGFAVVIAVVLAVVIFFIVPTAITNLFKGIVQAPILLNLIDGVIRLMIFMGYLLLVTCTKDIKRLFMYHGAEHKVINCFESEAEMTVENARKQSRLHPRCGTSYLLIVMVISILVFALLGWSDAWYLRFGLRIILLPFIAGLSYEVLKLAAKYENRFVRIVRAPGMALQRLTTREPDDSMLEISLIAFFIAENEKSPEEMESLIQQYTHLKQQPKSQEEQESEQVVVEPTLENANAAAKQQPEAMEKAEGVMEENQQEESDSQMTAEEKVEKSPAEPMGKVQESI